MSGIISISDWFIILNCLVLVFLVWYKVSSHLREGKVALKLQSMRLVSQRFLLEVVYEKQSYCCY